MIKGNIHLFQMTPAIGAEISNVDLTQPLSDQTFKEIHNALMTHSVIFFRDQQLTAPQLRDFALRFGTLNVHPFLPKVEDIPEITLFENDRERPPSVNVWHADLTALRKPPMGAILYAYVVPPNGGDTLWASMYAVYDALSDDVQRFISTLTAVHSIDSAAYAKALGDRVKVEQQGVHTAEHPVVRTHPETGRKCLFVNSGDTISITGMKKRESDALLQMLFKHVETPEFQVRFRWQRDSVAFWDNRCTQHYAVADYWPERRVMFRAAIEGDVPQ